MRRHVRVESPAPTSTVVGSMAMALLIAIVAASGSVADILSAADPFAFIRPSIHVSPNEKQKIDRGEVLVRILPGQGREIAVFAAASLNASGDSLVARVRDIVELKKSAYVPAIARFSDPPAIADLTTLTLDEVDLMAIKNCRRSDCDLKLGTDEIERLRGIITAQGDNWKVAVNEAFRRLVLERVNAYLARGHRGIPDYQARQEPVNLGSTFTTLLQRSPYLEARAADLAGYLEHYPVAQLPGVEFFLYWSKEKLGRKSVISVTHVTIVRSNGRSQFPDVLIASKQVFATHYMNGSLALTMLLSDPPGSSPSYLVYVNRSAVDVAGGFLGIRRGVIEGRLKRDTERLFAALRNRIEGITPSVARDE